MKHTPAEEKSALVVDTPSPSRSADLRARALRRVPGGVHSNVRLAAPSVFFERASGAVMWDVDGNDYIDYVLGQGPNFLGHANRRVNAAVASACERGMVFGGQHPLEIEASEAVLGALGWADMIRFGMTGTECVQAALRAARAGTGRTAFVRFEGHYHGWLDNMLMNWGGATPAAGSAGQVASHLTESTVLGWNDPDALAELFAVRGEQFAAVIMEPMMVNAGAIEPRPGYLRRVRDLCDKYGVVLIFDEVITGFRLARGGAVQRYGVVPDLATYGKAMAGGWPVAALAGKAELMEPFGTGAVNHSGTFNGSVMAAAAVLETQRVLDEDPPYQRVEAFGGQLMNELAATARDHGVALAVQGVPAAFHVSFALPGATAGPVAHDLRDLRQVDLARYARLATRLAGHGLWVAQRGIWYVSAAHAAAELDATLTRFGAALRAGLA